MMLEWLRPLCTKVRGKIGILDSFDHGFYIRFDCSEDPETPEAKGTCDILICHPGEIESIRVIANARRMHVMRFLFALGVERFPEAIRTAMYDRNSVIRTQSGTDEPSGTP